MPIIQNYFENIALIFLDDPIVRLHGLTYANQGT